MGDPIASPSPARSEPEFAGQSLGARVDARVRHLPDKLALWHRAMTPADEARILHRAFQ